MIRKLRIDLIKNYWQQLHYMYVWYLVICSMGGGEGSWPIIAETTWYVWQRIQSYHLAVHAGVIIGIIIKQSVSDISRDLFIGEGSGT